MGKFLPKAIRPAALIAVTGWLFCGLTSSAPAQDHTPDPYKPYSGMYDSFAFPSYPNPSGYVPNQSLIQGRSPTRGANQFQNYLDEIEGRDLSGRRSGVGVPYYQSYRRFDSDFDRVYRPNAEVDAKFFEEQKARHKKYLEYLRERDPKKRAQLYREYTQESQRFSRDLRSPRNFMSRASTSDSALEDEMEPSTTTRRPKAPRNTGRTTGRGASTSSGASTKARTKGTTSGRTTKPATSRPSSSATESRTNPER